MVSKITADAALSRLDPADRCLVEAFRDRVREQLGPRLRDLRLFGSKVRGDDHEESDLDILVLVDALDEATFDAIIEVASALRGPSLVSPHVREFDAYHAPRSRASGFYQEMREQSVRL
jgi:predicted nucleotidyltransferase